MVWNPLSAFDMPMDKPSLPESQKPLSLSGTKKISILQTTDVHCQIHPHDELFWENEGPVFRTAGGYPQLTTKLKQLRADSDHAFALDTGDMFQGSELSIETTGKAYVPILNAMGYDLYLPGNWEVVYGKENMKSLMGNLGAPTVCANMYHDQGNGQKGQLIFPPYHVWNVEGIKIGFLGYTDHLVPQRQSPMYSKGIVYARPEENLAHYVDVLKNQERCDAVFIIAHIGLSQQIALANLPDCAGVDYILGGDTHERVRVPISCRYAKVVEPGAFGSFIGKLDLYVKEGKIVHEDYELVEVQSDLLLADPEVERIVQSVEKPFLGNISAVIGYSTLPLYRYFVIENTIDTLILNALKDAFPDTDIVLSNGFRFCPPRSSPDATGNIPITNGYLFDMLPIDSVIRKGEVKGHQIKEWLEKELNNVFAHDASQRFGGWLIKFKGMEVTFHAFGKEGQRARSIHIGGKPLKDDETYTLLACEREGDADDVLCRMKNVRNTHNTTHTLHSVIKAYLKENSPVTPTPNRSAICLDAPATLLTQVSGVDYRFT